jgi:dihydrofolate synthase / folylpolyglutamate synthase
VFGPPSGDPLAARLFPPLPATVRWGLDRIQRILASAGGPQRAYGSLVVGGTNGKGSVAHLWARILEENGFRVGLYTSPHLTHFPERIQVNGVPLPDTLLEEVAEELRSPIIRNAPSFFEATTALALTAFARAGVDLAVLEVGMGGRLDAVNVVDPLLTAITNVGLDHEAYLGSTVEAIAREKAGILRPGVPAFTASSDPRVLGVLREEAAFLGLPLVQVPPPPGESRLQGEGAGTSLLLPTRLYGPLELHTPLLGAHQRSNVALAVRSLEALPPKFLPSRRAMIQGVAKARVPGRLQVEVEGPRQWLFDVAHNPDGVRVLMDALRDLAPPAPRVGVVGILGDKPAEGMVRMLAEGLDSVILTHPPDVPQGRRWTPERVAEALLGEGFQEVSVVPELGAALQEARSRTERDGTVLVAGSFYTVGSALTHLGFASASAGRGG